MTKKKVRTISIQDELWIPFVNKYKSASKIIREWISRDLGLETD